MPARDTEKSKRRLRHVVTDEGGVVRAKSDDVHEAWSLYHAEQRVRTRRLQPVNQDGVPEGMEGSYYL